MQILRYSFQHGTKLTFTHDPEEAVHQSDVIVTDTWVSMGQEEEAKARLEAFKGYQVDRKVSEARTLKSSKALTGLIIAVSPDDIRSQPWLGLPALSSASPRGSIRWCVLWPKEVASVAGSWKQEMDCDGKEIFSTVLHRIASDAMLCFVVFA